MLFFKKKEKRAAEAEQTANGPADNVVQFEDSLLRSLIGGTVSMDKRTAMEIPAVQACVNLIAGIISLLPVKLYEEKDGEVTEVAGDPRVRMLSGDTGDTINGTEMRKLWVKDYFLGKGSYTYISRDVYGFPDGLYYVDESRISAFPNNKAIFKDYTLLVDGTAYFRSDFIKLLRNSMGDGRGTSIIEESGTILLIAYNTMKFENGVVKKGGNKRGFLTSQKQQSADSMREVKESWGKMYSNSQDMEDSIVVLNEGMDFKEASATSLEMQLNENKQTNAGEICRLFGVPAEIFYGKFTEDVKERLISDCITPLVNLIEAALDSDLLLEKEKGVRYFACDMKELTRGNILQRYQAYEIGLRNSFLQADEVREQEDLKPLGFNFIRLGLQDVLLDPENNRIYTPNTNAMADLSSEAAGFLSAGEGERAFFREMRFNPNHGSDGKFTSGGAFAGGHAEYPVSGKGGPNDKTKRFSGGGKGVDKAENGDIIKPDDFSYISAVGPNEFKKGFSASNLADHWIGNEVIHSHKGEYPDLTMEQYGERALNLVQKPVSKTVWGYKTNDGCVVRYDIIENDFVKGNPYTGIKTMFKPVEGAEYYKRREKNESYK